MIAITHENIGSNQSSVVITTDRGRITLWFSYDTLVAVDNLVSQNEWSRTTGKLLNDLEPEKAKRVPKQEVLKEAQRKLREIILNNKELMTDDL